MEKPPKPANESERLEALHNLDILDGPTEFRFDRITRLAARSIGTEFSEINLIDEDRQWSKSQYGTRERETPREESFCAHAILEDDPLVIPDARQDSRFRDNPSVQQFPNIRFYMSCPIRSPEGYNIGTLCVFDPRQQSPTTEDREMLRDLADLAEEELAKPRESLPGLESAPVDYLDVMGEIHHQVRNNMQTILSLLELHEAHADESSTARAIPRTKQRTRTIALLYDCLTETNDTINVDMETYLSELVHDVIQANNPSPLVEFDVEFDPITMSIERAPVCGLLIHELVTNAVQHGYGPDESGTIQVEFRRVEDGDGEYYFRVQDDGRGLPDGFDWTTEGNVGMTLIRNITERKFDGTLNYSSDDGTRIEGSF